MKMYILIPDDIPSGHAINSAAHASLACYVEYQNDSDMQVWFTRYFKKVTCKVTRKELEEIKHKYTGSTLIHEGALNGELTAVAFKPRREWPPEFRTFNLYS